MKVVYDLEGNLVEKPKKCKNCGYTKGQHKANTLNCPFDGKRFTSFYKDKIYSLEEKDENEI